MRLVPVAQLAPQARHLAAEQTVASGALLTRLCDVVEGDEAAGAHQRPVVVEVAADAVVGVVAVDQEEVELLAAQRPARARERGGGGGGAPGQGEPPRLPDETAVQRNLPHRIAAAELALWQVDADDRRRALRREREEEERPPAGRADLEQPSRLLGGNDREQPADLGAHLAA